MAGAFFLPLEDFLRRFPSPASLAGSSALDCYRIACERLNSCSPKLGAILFLLLLLLLVRLLALREVFLDTLRPLDAFLVDFLLEERFVFELDLFLRLPPNNALPFRLTPSMLWASCLTSSLTLLYDFLDSSISNANEKYKKLLIIIQCPKR